MALGIKTRRAIQDAVDEQKEFEIGNVKGIKWNYANAHMPPTGRLYDEQYKMLRGQCHRNMVGFLIYSYGTPIAWLLWSGEWVVPDVKYSVTTTMHQGVVRTAIANYGFWHKIDRG